MAVGSRLFRLLIYDTRDFEPDPTSGYYFEIANEYSGKYIGSQFEFNKLFLQEKGFGSCLSVRTVVASRLGVGNIFGSNAPFLNFKINGVQMAVLTLWEENNPCVGIEQIGFVALIMVY
jgi:outer membrane translocation and assembly module TamA